MFSRADYRLLRVGISTGRLPSVTSKSTAIQKEIHSGDGKTYPRKVGNREPGTNDVIDERMSA